MVEDAHWADEATLDLLVFLGRRLERTPVLLLVTYRDDELGADHPLRGVLGALPQGVVHRLRPQPLSEAAVAELARRAGRSASGLLEVTGGNPWGPRGGAAGDAGVPWTVRDLVLARLAACQQTPRRSCGGGRRSDRAASWGLLRAMGAGAGGGGALRPA